SKFASMSGANVDQINNYIQQMGAKVSRSLAQLSESQIESAVKSSMARGENFTDWNLIYRIKIKNPDHAYELMNILKSSELVDDVQPLPIPSVSDAGITSDISGDQDYLKSNAQSGGLNVETAWSKATGEGVTIMDMEGNWNFDHEDLPIGQDDVVFIPDEGVPPQYLENNVIQHGTAVAGVLSGLDNNLGIKGISYSAGVKVAHTEALVSGPIGTVESSLLNYNNGNTNEAILYEGDIVLIEMHTPGPVTFAEDKACGDLFSGCLLVEAYPSTFGAVSDAVNAGFIVIEAAANGVANLDDPIHHIEGGPDLSNFVSGSENDSGAIVVGASTGASHEKALWSNCGSRVNVYAWGYDVTTAGYGDHAASDPANQNKWYTANFSGTSSAAAIIAGAAAVIQSYAREIYGHNPPYKNVYLDSYQMRDLLIASGQNTPFLPGTDPQDPHPNCNIGVQPDVNYALQLLDEGYVVPNIKFKPVTQINGQPAAKLDFDGDGRADLIVYRNKGWHVDLSSVGSGGDNFGGDTWDVTINMGDDDPEASVQPVVADYNSDGYADLALYAIKSFTDGEAGKWYIAYTDEDMINNGTWHGWDKIVDYSDQPHWQPYSRAVHGDYDGDGWMDLALQTPDGYWLIDYGLFETKMDPDTGVPYLDPEEGWDGFVDYADDPETTNVDETRIGIKKYLTDQQLQDAPGWAYLPVHRNMTGVTGGDDILYKVPDGLPGIGEIFGWMSPKFVSFLNPTPIPTLFGGNDEVLVTAKYFGFNEIGVKTSDGNFEVADDDGWDGWYNLEPNGVFGGITCEPVPSDYDGDGYDDRATYCGINEWRIAYTSNTFTNQMEDGLRTIFTESPYARPFPPVVYPGGTALQEIAAHFDIWTMNPPVLPTFNACFDYWAHWSPTGPDKVDGCAH
ncbi:S8 family serine peptidase, partial [bacterium]|nr:S8 family serine peptidase [bacterium]